MSTASDALTAAGKLTKIAEDLESKLQLKIDKFEAEATKAREQFEAGLVADRDKVKEARREAATAIRKAGAAMGDAPSATRTSAGTRGSLDRDVALSVLRDAGAAGINGKQVADKAGVSAPTARKVLDALVADGAARTEGERRGKKFFAT